VKSNYLVNKKLDAEYRGQAWSPPASRYVGFLTCTKGLRSLANSQAVSLNDTLCVVANDSKLHLYKVTGAGSLAAAQGTLYPGVANEAVTDGSAQLTEQDSALRAGTAAVEPSGGGYARQAISGALAAWSGTQGAGTTVASSGTSGQISNNTQVTFPAPTGDWAKAPVTIWATATYDLLTAGSLLEIAPALAAKNVASGDQAPIIPAGSLILGET
jgi:hypothetical protein